MTGQDGSFEEVFGFRPPMPEEAQGAADDLNFKMSNDGRPTGSAAFFGVGPLKDIAVEFMTIMAAQHAEEAGIPPQVAWDIIYSGFIGALEIMAAARLRVDD